MKILNRQDFLKMPQGTFYAKGIKWYIDGFCIKRETYFDQLGKAIDFTYYNLVDFEWKSSEDHADSCDKMLETGQSREINKSYMRDGCFCDEDLFLVFEKTDLDHIKSLMF